MPKKEKKKIIKLNTFELEEILKERTKKSEVNKKEIKPKTKSLKEIKPINVDTFQNFFYPRSKFTAPVLNQIEQSQEIINLERGISNSPKPTLTNNQEDQFKYSGITAAGDEKKYLASSAHMTTQTAQVDITKIGREKAKVQEAQFMQAPELQGIQSPQWEKYASPEFVDTRNLGKENQFERKTERKRMDYEPLH
jgi:hypothetical protein